MRKIILFLERNSSPCVFKDMTGHECPGCGFQRSIIALLKGDIVESFILYPALLPILFTLSVFFLRIIFNVQNEALILKYSLLLSILIIIISYIIKTLI